MNAQETGGFKRYEYIALGIWNQGTPEYVWKVLVVYQIRLYPELQVIKQKRTSGLPDRI